MSVRCTRKGILKVLAGIVATPFVLLTLLVALLYVPPVQQWAVKEITAYAREYTGWDVSIERVRLKWVLDLDLQGLHVESPDLQLNAKHVAVDLDFSRILSLKLGVEGIDLQEADVDTRSMIETMVVKGRLDNFHLDADKIDLKRQKAYLGHTVLDGADIDIAMRDTTVVDTTTSEPTRWQIALGDVRINNSKVRFRSAGDTLDVTAGIRMLNVERGRLDLGKESYALAAIDAEFDSVIYSLPYVESTQGLDYNHLALSDVALLVKDFNYSDGTLSLLLDKLKGKERSGLELCSGKAHVQLTDNGVQVDNLEFLTPNSELIAEIDVPWNALEESGGSALQATLRARVGYEDMVIVMPETRTMLPRGDASLHACISGNVDTLFVDSLALMLDPMLSLDAQGDLLNLTSSTGIDAKLAWKMRTFDMRHVAKLAEMSGSLRIPQLSALGDVRLNGNNLVFSAHVKEGQGWLDASVCYDMECDIYELTADTKNLNLHHFLYRDSLYLFDSHVSLKGRGTDLLASSTRFNASARIHTLQYGHHDLGGIQADVRVVAGKADAEIAAENALLTAQACVEADLHHRLSAAQFSLAVAKADLHALGLIDKPFTLSMMLQADGSTDFKRRHQLKGSVRAAELELADTIVHPQDMNMELMFTPDTSRVWAQAGDLYLDFQSPMELQRFLGCFNKIEQQVEQQFEKRELNQALLREMLPLASVKLSSGKANPVSNILKQAVGITFESVNLDLQSDNTSGLNGSGSLLKLNTGSLVLDTIRLALAQDTAGVLGARVHVANNKKNPQVTFCGDVRATLAPTGIGMMTTLFDAHGRKGLDMGVELNFEEQGMRLHLNPLTPILAYRRFTLNPDNYVYLSNERRLEADIDLLADDGTGFKLYTTPNEQALQDITLSVYDINLDELTAVFPYVPSIGGKLAGDVHFVQDEQSVSFGVDAHVDKLEYEGAYLGNMGVNATYLPNTDGTHFVDGIILHEGQEIAALSGSYNPEGEGLLDAQATLQHLPLALANGFIGEGVASLKGYADAQLEVNGTLSHPMMNGHLSLDSMYVHSPQYSLDLRFPNDTLLMQESVFRLNRIEAYSKGKNPLVLDGTVDCRSLDNIKLDLSVEARNFELINAPKTRHSIAYGRVYVNLMSRLTGTLDDLNLRGRLVVLGNTNLNYVLTDSPLTVEDQLADLVTFTDFTNVESPVETVVAKPQNVDMRLMVSIEQAAQMHVLLSEDGTNYVNIEGGGDLTLTYTSRNDLQLFGRYTIVSGDLNYTLMVMSLRDCKIQPGSYAEFTGNISNPRLNLTATERVKTTVYEDKVPRSVVFEVGIAITQTLDDMGMTFTIDAPEDLAVSNQLAAMGVDGRGKVAVTMLATGMYLTDEGSAQGFSGTNALNSFLQTQIASISNKALKTIDLNFGVDNTNTASGATQTDYSFSFAKRFWGNRISLIVGGKVSSGAEAQNTGQSIVDNVSIEYRLDNSATRYVRLYYDRNTESLMEGEITEMGAGIVLRRKSTRLGELFIFRKKDKEKISVK